MIGILGRLSIDLSIFCLFLATEFSIYFMWMQKLQNEVKHYEINEFLYSLFKITFKKSNFCRPLKSDRWWFWGHSRSLVDISELIEEEAVGWNGSGRIHLHGRVGWVARAIEHGRRECRETRWRDGRTLTTRLVGVQQNQQVASSGGCVKRELLSVTHRTQKNIFLLNHILKKSFFFSDLSNFLERIWSK